MQYKNTEPENMKIELFIIIKLFGIFLFSKNDRFIACNDVENIYTEPNKQEDTIIELYIIV